MGASLAIALGLLALLAALAWSLLGPPPRAWRAIATFVVFAGGSSP